MGVFYSIARAIPPPARLPLPDLICWTVRWFGFPYRVLGCHPEGVPFGTVLVLGPEYTWGIDFATGRSVFNQWESHLENIELHRTTNRLLTMQRLVWKRVSSTWFWHHYANRSKHLYITRYTTDLLVNRTHGQRTLLRVHITQWECQNINAFSKVLHPYYWHSRKNYTVNLHVRMCCLESKAGIPYAHSISTWSFGSMFCSWMVGYYDDWRVGLNGWKASLPRTNGWHCVSSTFHICVRTPAVCGRSLLVPILGQTMIWKAGLALQIIWECHRSTKTNVGFSKSDVTNLAEVRRT